MDQARRQGRLAVDGRERQGVPFRVGFAALDVVRRYQHFEQRGDAGLLQAADDLLAQRPAHQGEGETGSPCLADELGSASEERIAVATDLLAVVGRLAGDEARQALRRAGFARGGERGGEVLLEQAWASFRFTDWMSLRAGALLVPFGNFNVDHYAPSRDVISKPLVAYVVAPGDWTDNGLGLSGTVLLGGEWALRYDTAVVAGLDDNITALGTRAARQPFGADNNNDKALVGRLGWKYGGAFELGMSAYDGAYDDAGRLSLSGFALDALAVLGPLRVTGEIDRLEASQAVGPDAELGGWYVRSTLDLATRWLRSGRHGEAFPEARLSLVGQVERIDLAGPLDGGWEDNSEKRLTLGLNYRPTTSWVLKLDREWRRAPGRALVFGDEEAWLASFGFVF